MNRYLSLIVSLIALILIYSFCCHFLYDYPQSIVDEEIYLVDNQIPDYPIDDDNGKLKDFNIIPQIVLVMIVLSITSFFSLFAALTRRLMLLTAIFYQSNYLINSLK